MRGATPMISVTMVATNVYEVVVEGTTETTHRVRLSPDYYQKLSGRQFTHEWVIVQAFQFLLDRKANTDIEAEFDLAGLNRYFADFEAEIERRLHRR